MLTSLAVALTVVMAPEPGAGGTDLAACRNEVTRLRAESAALDLEYRRRLFPREVFAQGAPNPAAQAALTPAIERILKGSAAGAPAYTLECRTRACRLLVAETREEHERSREWTRLLQSDE